MKTTNLVVLAVSVLLILVVINFLVARRAVWRVDLTKNKIYTLSDASKKVVRDLDDLVTIKAYFSERMPPYLANMKEKVVDLLNEYQTYAKGNLQVKFIDPSDDEEKKRSLMYEGIMPIPLQTVEKHKLEFTEAYFSMSINYEGRKETIPVVNPETLEYDLTSAIKKVSITDPPTVAFYTNNEELEIDQDFRGLQMAIEKLNEVRPVEIKPGQKIPEDIDVLFLISPQDFSDSELFEIDQFVMRGGNLVILMEAVEVDQRTLQASVSKPNLADILSDYGLEVEENLIQDFQSNSMASFSSGYMTTMVQYPFWVSLSNGLNEENPITQRLQQVVLPWASSLKIGEDAPEDVNYTILGKTTEFALAETDPFNLNPFDRQKKRPQKEDLKQYDMVIIANGTFTSAFEGEEIPEADVSEEEGPRPPRGGTTEENRKNISEETSIFLVANAQFARDRGNPSNRQDNNLILLQNTVDSMVLGKDLINIRSRGNIQRPIDADIEDDTKTTIKRVAILAAPVLVILFALIRIPWVRARRRHYANILTDK